MMTVLFWQDIHRIDQETTLLLNGLHCNLSDTVMTVFSNIPVWIPMYVAIVIFLFMRLGWKKALIATGSILLTFGICDQFSNLIKEAVARPRPCHDEFMIQEGLRILEGKGGKYGFFSAHAANAFGLAVSSLSAFRQDRTRKYKGYACWIFFWAAMVSISRIFVGKHYLGDILVGAVAGTVIGLISAIAARYLMAKVREKV